MPFARPTLPTLRLQARARINARIAGADGRPRRSVLGILADIFAGMLWGAYGYLDYLAGQLLPDTATDYLPRWTGIYGQAPNSSTLAAGNAIFTGIAPSPIPVDTQLVDQTGVAYQTTAAAVLVGAGTATVPIAALVGGSNGNQDPGTILTLVSAVPGVAGTAAVDSNGLKGGIDVESITSQRARLLTRIRNPPRHRDPILIPNRYFHASALVGG